MLDPETPAALHEPAPTPPGAVAGVAVAIATFVLQQLVVGLAWNVVPAGAGLALGGILGVCVPLAVWSRRTGVPLAAWLHLRRLSARDILLVNGFAAALLAPTYALNAYWQQLVPPDDGVLGFYAALVPHGPATLLLGALGVVFFGPLAEEWVFRGLLQPALARRLPAPAAIPLVALVFAAAHASLAFFPAIFLLGLGLGAVAWWTRSTYASWIVHALMNAVAYADLCITRTPETPELDRWAVQWVWLAGSVVVLAVSGWFLAGARRTSSPPGAARESAPAPFPGRPSLPVESKYGSSKDGEA